MKCSFYWIVCYPFGLVFWTARFISLNNLVLRGLDFLTGFVDLIAQLVMHI